MTDRTEAMDNLIAQDADLLDAQPTQSDDNFHKLALNESFERVAQVAKEREAFNEQAALNDRKAIVAWGNIEQREDVRSLYQIAHEPAKEPYI